MNVDKSNGFHFLCKRRQDVKDRFMSSHDPSFLTDPTQWVERYGDYLYTYAYYRVGSAEVAEDLVQDTFIAALNARQSFRGESSEKTWLVSILKRKIIDHYRKETRSREEPGDDRYSPFVDEGPDRGKWDVQHRPADWTTETTDMDRETFYQVLELCLSLLPERWSGVFRLKTLEELPTQQVCKELGITSSNFWVIMHRARLRLRECFEKNWFEA